VRIPLDKLQPGMHVSLAERWCDHPFLFNEFTLESEEQIQIIRNLGMSDVLWCASASDHGPREVAGAPPLAPEIRAQVNAHREERRRQTDNARQRTGAANKAYVAAAAELREAFALVFSSPQAAVDKVTGVVSDVVGAFASGDDVSIVLLSDRMTGNNMHTHAINVMLLSLMIGKSLQLTEQELNEIGLGAMFHDVGKLKVPDAIRMKPEAEWSRMDHDYMQKHTELGVKMILTLPEFGPLARAVIAMHHENFDGSGYPFKLAGEKIPLAARLAAVANRYDNLCNPPNMQNAVPPSEALSRMFKVEGALYDPSVLARFIKSMGVYPPGSLVELSNGVIGLVSSVNHENSLRPLVTIWQANTKPEDAPIVDLAAESEIAIARSLRASELEPEVREYLN
ncbi:unnamed protein product, partial [Phaeothamnion confervicola]